MKKWEDFEIVVAKFFDLKLHNIPGVNEKGRKILINIRDQIYEDEGLKNGEGFSLQFSETVLSLKVEKEIDKFSRFLSVIKFINQRKN